MRSDCHAISGAQFLLLHNYTVTPEKLRRVQPFSPFLMILKSAPVYGMHAEGRKRHIIHLAVQRLSGEMCDCSGEEAVHRLLLFSQC